VENATSVNNSWLTLEAEMEAAVGTYDRLAIVTPPQMLIDAILPDMSRNVVKIFS
jgi:hypothetical protein